MDHEIVNVDQASAWDGPEGAAWAADWQAYDRSTAAYREDLLDAAAIRDGEWVLDVGCGNGRTSRDAARRTPSGHVLGIDLSAPMLARARQLAADEGISNLVLVQGDAQVHPFEAGAFAVAIGSFSTMFFADKKAGFANIAHSLRPGGRLALLAWQAVSENEQFRTIFGALAAGRGVPSPPPGAPSPFGLADEATGRDWVAAAGFVDIGYESLHRPFNIADTAQEAYDFFVRSPMTTGMTRDLDEPTRASALAALHDALSAHETSDGVVFDSAVWRITARLR